MTFYLSSLHLPPTSPSALKSAFVQFLITFSYKKCSWHLNAVHLDWLPMWLVQNWITTSLYVSVNLYSKNRPFTSSGRCSAHTDASAEDKIFITSTKNIVSLVCIIFICFTGLVYPHLTSSHKDKGCTKWQSDHCLIFVILSLIIVVIFISSLQHWRCILYCILSQKHTHTPLSTLFNKYTDAFTRISVDSSYNNVWQGCIMHNSQNVFLSVCVLYERRFIKDILNVEMSGRKCLCNQKLQFSDLLLNSSSALKVTTDV